MVSSWSLIGLFLALGPRLSAMLFRSGDHLVDGTSIFVLAAAASVTQVAIRHMSPWKGAATGSLILAAGMMAIVAAASVGSGELYLAGSAIAGVGFGGAFLSALKALSAAIPAHNRGEVMSAFYIVAYSSLSLPAILAGALDKPLGLEPTVAILGSVIAAAALGVAVQARRTRPTREQIVAPILDLDRAA